MNCITYYLDGYTTINRFSGKEQAVELCFTHAVLQINAGKRVSQELFIDDDNYVACDLCGTISRNLSLEIIDANGNKVNISA